jgi:hypothetical protein
MILVQIWNSKRTTLGLISNLPKINMGDAIAIFNQDKLQDTGQDKTTGQGFEGIQCQ